MQLHNRVSCENSERAHFWVFRDDNVEKVPTLLCHEKSFRLFVTSVILIFFNFGPLVRKIHKPNSQLLHHRNFVESKTEVTYVRIRASLNHV